MIRSQQRKLYPEDAQTLVTLGEAATFSWRCPADPADTKARKKRWAVISAIVNGMSKEYLRQIVLTHLLCEKQKQNKTNKKIPKSCARKVGPYKYEVK